VLDVGCGTGRLLLDYLGSGVDIDGVDNSPDMLALCRAKAARLGLRPILYQQYMQDLDIPRRYCTILVPSSSFQLVTAMDDADDAMARFYGHLQPGGVLVMPFMILSSAPVEQRTVVEDWQLVAEKTRPDDGAVVRRWSRSTYDLIRQLEHTEDRYEVTLCDRLIAQEHRFRSPATRWYTQQQARGMYERAGFGDVHVYSQFTFEPADAGDTVFTVVGARLR
jgi:ubiquinone/menaquinone biosynthesis C-methylase UbiE